jgi:DNA-binding transcriptional MerR regulator
MTQNPFADFNLYKNQLTISQVIKFLERFGIVYKKTTIQYYLGLGLIPELINSRYYEKRHIQLLYVIFFLKDIYALDKISMAISPYFDEPSPLVDMLCENIAAEEPIKPMIRTAIQIHNNMASLG